MTTCIANYTTYLGSYLKLEDLVRLRGSLFNPSAHDDLSILTATTQPAATFTTQLLLLPQLWPIPMGLKTQGTNASMDKDRESRHIGPSHVGELEEVKEWRQSLEGRLLDAHACKTSPP